ncbi:two-component response regulator ARR14-like [Solanum tuberosum]|uniref:two-component response regulator ARR14-like n=1 Tax=Solanum tuberosum TaxID=4113 RepID=UPI00073A2528|nr:PREDICTED: two-component response regulator ARR14-like [Solanum tuberosum]
MEVQNSKFSVKIITLVVDDDDSCLLIISTLLKQSKFEVMMVKSAKDALSVLRSSDLSFDIVIIEVHMPEMNDFQLQQEIAKDLCIPVVYLSGDENDFTAIKALESGVVFFILKPISQDDIHYLWEYATLRKKKHIGKRVAKRDKSARKYDETKNKYSLVPPTKKSRIAWTDSLHEFFLEAITTLGMRAYPKKIVELMDVPELTSRHLAYHLKEEANTSRIRELLMMNPPTFTGSSTTDDPGNFVEELQKVFEVMHVADSE